MTSDQFAADIEIPVDGYQWEMRKGGWCLSPKNRAGECRRFDVFTRPALHREFAAAEQNREAILDFANRYGRVVLIEDVWIQWQRELKHAIAVWDALRQGKAPEVSDVMHNYGSETSPTFEGKYMKFIEPINPSFKPEHVGPDGVMRPVNLKDPIDCARYFLDKEISVHTRAVSINIRRNSEGGMVLKFHVRDYISALWVQFAAAIADEVSFNKCQECGIPIPLSTHRSDAKYCSEACTMAAYRKRKKKVIAMHAAGSTLRAISKETGSDVDTIKKWLQPQEKTDAKKKKGTRRR